MLSAPHDLSLFVSPGDEVTHLGGMPWTDRAGRETQAEFYLVLHRGHGCWTHLYRLIPGARAERFQLILEKVAAGDARRDIEERFFTGPGSGLAARY